MKTRISFLSIALIGLFLNPATRAESTAGSLGVTDTDSTKKTIKGDCREITGTVTDREAEGLLFMWEEEDRKSVV